MPRLSTVQQRVRQQLLSLAHRRLSPQVLAADILETIDIAIPADGWVLYGVDPPTLLFNRVLGFRAPNFQQDALALVHGYLENSYLVREPPTLSPPGLMRAGVRVTLSNDRLDACWGLPPHLVDDATARRWHEFYREDIGATAGGSVSAYFRAGQLPVAALDGFRIDPAQPFRENEGRFLQQLAPTIGGMLATALNREKAAWPRFAEEPTLAAPGVVILTERNRIQFCSAVAQGWLDAMRDQPGPVAPGIPGVPLAVWAAVARHRASGRRDAAVTALSPTRDGPVRIDVTRGEDDGSTVVVLSPERPPGPPALPTEWSLTPSQDLVARKAVAGHTNREIGEILSMTPHTVESHLKGIYEKAGVRSRGQLVAKLFETAILPTLDMRGPD